jgi:hypothetical protein
VNNYSLIELIGIDLVKVPSTQDSSVDFLSKVEIDRVCDHLFKHIIYNFILFYCSFMVY